VSVEKIGKPTFINNYGNDDDNDDDNNNNQLHKQLAICTKNPKEFTTI
jgi:hypothetical protein